MFQCLAQDLAGDLSVEKLADYLSQLADIIVAATVQAVWQTLPTRHREVPKFAVIAYGKLGGKELGYVSDLDVIFLFDDDDQEAPGLYAKLAQRFITWMTSHTSARGILFDIDIALRPDGASGMLVSSVQAFERYQGSAAWVWGTPGAHARAAPAMSPSASTSNASATRSCARSARKNGPLKAEVVAMRKKMLDAHPSRPGSFDLKQDSGGMIDIEFMVQYLVLQHAAQYPQLTSNSGNIALLRLCGELGLIDAQLAALVADAYLGALRKLQHQLRLQGQDLAPGGTGKSPRACG